VKDIWSAPEISTRLKPLKLDAIHNLPCLSKCSAVMTPPVCAAENSTKRLLPKRAKPPS
jgi:hypothetical protein